MLLKILLFVSKIRGSRLSWALQAILDIFSVNFQTMLQNPKWIFSSSGEIVPRREIWFSKDTPDLAIIGQDGGIHHVMWRFLMQKQQLDLIGKFTDVNLLNKLLFPPFLLGWTEIYWKKFIYELLSATSLTEVCSSSSLAPVDN